VAKTRFDGPIAKAVRAEVGTAKDGSPVMAVVFHTNYDSVQRIPIEMASDLVAAVRNALGEVAEVDETGEASDPTAEALAIMSDIHQVPSDQPEATPVAPVAAAAPTALAHVRSVNRQRYDFTRVHIGNDHGWSPADFQGLDETVLKAKHAEMHLGPNWRDHG
jgi:hypothetical protein